MAFDDPHPDDLAWQAFAYVADELDAEASASFEARLEADQSAREALAEAVLLAGSVALAGKVEAQRRRRFRVAALALAACLALAASPWLLAPRPTAGPASTSVSVVVPTPAPAASANPEAVALAWSGLRQETEAGNGPDADELIDRLAEPADALPPWLLEAAALPAPADGQGS